jgi:hypothetical protein
VGAVVHDCQAHLRAAQPGRTTRSRRSGRGGAGPSTGLRSGPRDRVDGPLIVDLDATLVTPKAEKQATAPHL